MKKKTKRFKHLGYIKVFKPEHPFSDNKGYMLEHRLVMEIKLGRYLKQDEIVHHKDGDRENNDISNLKLLSRFSHADLHCTNKKPVAQLSLGGQFIKKWESMTSAERALGISQGQVSAVCAGRDKSAKGYRFCLI